MGKSTRMPLELRTEMWDSIDERLKVYMKGRKEPEEIATTLNFILFGEFGKSRTLGSGVHALLPEFVGQYRVDSKEPSQIRVYSHHGSEACSPIPITTGILGRAIRTGEDQYIPDVVEDPEHIACSEKMEESNGTEIVLLSWSDKISRGPYKGERIPLGALDIDLNVTNAFSDKDQSRLKRVWNAYGSLIFPGEPEFDITPKLAELYEFLPDRNYEQRRTA